MQITGECSVQFDLSKATAAINAEVAKAMQGVGLHAMREAKRNAPKSPTMKQRSATLKRKRRTKQKSNAGGLERSIQYDVMGDTVSVYILQNAECTTAGGFNYAKRIHDEKGKSWFKRGAGTVAKGPQADEKFIQRAVFENAAKYQQKIDAAIQKALKGI